MATDCSLSQPGYQATTTLRYTETTATCLPPVRPNAGWAVRGLFSVFTQSQKDAMLNAHNNARSIASPTPCTPLPAMTWNTVLANVAQAYADRCINLHNEDRTSDANGAFGYVGENLFISTYTPSDPALSVTKWDEEKQYYDYDTLACTPGKVCGHYTQIVWNSSRQLGCGAKLCDAANTKSYPFDKSKYSKGYIVVCNYGPEGNYRGQKPYKACPTAVAPSLSSTAPPPPLKTASSATSTDTAVSTTSATNSTAPPSGIELLEGSAAGLPVPHACFAHAVLLLITICLVN
ncbi:peptidase inhibitor 16-like [Sycon ciliatum]|uniref:peptidase inhibitor 16-like n=1 Tax=Sycon ciliatum TaxID=27933 RepID=UPI0031F67F4B